MITDWAVLVWIFPSRIRRSASAISAAEINRSSCRGCAPVGVVILVAAGAKYDQASSNSDSSCQYLKRLVSTRARKSTPSWALLRRVNLKGVTAVCIACAAKPPPFCASTRDVDGLRVQTERIPLRRHMPVGYLCSQTRGPQPKLRPLCLFQLFCKVSAPPIKD